MYTTKLYRSFGSKKKYTTKLTDHLGVTKMYTTKLTDHLGYGFVIKKLTVSEFVSVWEQNSNQARKNGY
jgi:flagellar biosynthesis chaperone FliJ